MSLKNRVTRLENHSIGLLEPEAYQIIIVGIGQSKGEALSCCGVFDSRKIIFVYVHSMRLEK